MSQDLTAQAQVSGSRGALALRPFTGRPQDSQGGERSRQRRPGPRA
eukprot:CAMPEP_0118986254 /NCGR_PEP_ID=MMETSP1173-20130426/41743_1 /TAXON_ID=1034831 /ORGANISM="Rhizochromulina marina cf, Strain CCMP1243" /LENGTH=45 /DNA_ID= /DNA_START= /DNA_END= /DNA_ORIENTATION=